MHAWLGLTGLLLVFAGGYLALAVLRRLEDWAPRRGLQLGVLAAPLGSLLLGLVGLHHFAGQSCFLGAPPLDYVVGVGLPLGMGLLALGAVILGLVRQFLVEALVARCGGPADPALQALANDLALRLGTPRPRVRLWAHGGPPALTCGVIRPTLLLSTWTVERLDRRELESVVAHELAHVARRDYPVVWVATILRDAFFYLPASRAAFRLLQCEKELACDDIAAAATNRPLALASALTKVWHRAAGGWALEAAQALTGTGASPGARIERLLAVRASPLRGRPSQGVSLAYAAAVLAGLVALEVANLGALLTVAGCGALQHALGL